LHNWFIIPNLHVILIHYPLGVFVLGAIIEIFSFLWPRSSARQAAQWMILLGALLMLPTIMSGVYALSDITRGGHQALSPEQVHQMTWHIWLEGAAAFVTLFIIIAVLGASDSWRNRLHWPMALALLCVIGLMGAGAWFGGESVYRTGTAVLPVQGLASSIDQPESRFYYFVGPPLQIHMILFGGLMAFTAVALGLSIRRITRLSAMHDEAMLSPHNIGLGPETTEGSLLPDIESLPPEPRIASTRYWFFAFVFAALTALAGFWFWAHDSGDNYNFHDFWQDTMAGPTGRLTLDRTSVHVWIAIAIIATTIILSFVIHFARPSKLLLTIFAGLLVLLLAAQFWIGILLAFRGSEGPLLHFERVHRTDTAGAMNTTGKMG
jgi:uncharacterized membrane protein